MQNDNTQQSTKDNNDDDLFFELLSEIRYQEDITMARGKKLSTEEQIEKLKEQLAELEAAREVEQLKDQALEAVAACDDIDKLKKILKMF